jgi:transposase
MERRQFTREFKLEAVRLIKDRGVSYAKAAEDLGIHPTQLRNWVKQLADDPQHAFPGHGQMKPEQLEIAQLKRACAKRRRRRNRFTKFQTLGWFPAHARSIRRAVSRSVYPETVSAPQTIIGGGRRQLPTGTRPTANQEALPAAMLLKMLNGIPGFRPASIAPLTRWTVPFTASETSAMVDFDSGTGSKPS